MQNNALRLVILFFLGLIGKGTSVFAQNITKSPYSIIGVGDMVYSGNASSYSMGQTNQAIRNPFAVNMLNPASYSSLLTTNIEAGATMSFGTFKGAANTNNVNNAWISYLNFALPLSTKRGIGVSFGAAPFSSVGYNIVSNVKIPQDTFSIDALNNFVGRGGLSKFYMGYGMRLHRTVSLGVNGNYIFGQTTNTTQLLIPSQYLMFNTNEDKSQFMHGWLMDFGVQIHDTFSRIVDNDVRVYEWVIGGTLTPETNLKAEQSYLLRSLPVGSTSGIKDTVYSQTSEQGTVTAPMAFRGGLSFSRKDMYTIAADIKGTQWSNFRSFGGSDSLKNSFGASLGASIVPNYKSKNYFSRLEYRVGARYEKSSLVARGVSVDVMAVTAGIGLPMTRSNSKVNVGVEFQKRGTTDMGLVQENYFRVYIGISFADYWFHRYRYD
ncbi:MAG: hypothetical protein CFE21_15840 [Bacteroidetes bacterium B1(2017)]|nr:MAG: hypothetical protein CFE21_15840 [Bacteroidetes bacterium B1(2017)]